MGISGIVDIQPMNKCRKVKNIANLLIYFIIFVNRKDWVDIVFLKSFF